MNEIEIIKNFHDEKGGAKQFFDQSEIKEFSEATILYHCTWRLNSLMNESYKYVDNFIEKKLIELQPSFFSYSSTKRINKILLECYSYDNDESNVSYQRMLSNFIFSLKFKMNQKVLIVFLKKDTKINSSHIFTLENYPENFLNYKISFPENFIGKVISSVQSKYSNIEIMRMLLYPTLNQKEDDSDSDSEEEEEEEEDFDSRSILLFHDYFFKSITQKFSSLSEESSSLSKKYSSFIKNLDPFILRGMLRLSDGRKFFIETSFFTIEWMVENIMSSGISSLLKEVASSLRWEELKLLISKKNNSKEEVKKPNRFFYLSETLEEWKNSEINLIKFSLSTLSLSVDIENILSKLSYSKCLNEERKNFFLNLEIEIESRPPLVVLVLREMLLNNTLRISRLGLFS